MRIARFLFVGLSLAAVGCGDSTSAVTLEGSGATFPAPVYKRWFLEYYRQHPDVRVNYSAIGSGAGIRQFTGGLVAFGASDAGMSKKEVAKLPPDYGGALILPMTAGCIVLSYNLEGLSRPLQLSRKAYVAIFERGITRWNDPELARTNPGLELPDRAITVVTRADSSGTTYAFTNHMAAVASAVGIDWSPGVDKSVHFKQSISAQGNDGVAALIQLTPGAVGYIEFGYAKLTGLPIAALENKAGRFVVPDDAGDAGQAALQGAPIPEDLQIKVPDPSADDAYPIVTYTWMLCRKHYKDAKLVSTLKALIEFGLDPGQQHTANQLGYVPLPPEVVRRVKAQADGIGVES